MRISDWSSDVCSSDPGIGGDGDEGNAEFLDAYLADVLAQRIDEMTPADHAAGAHAKVHVGDHAQPRERARPGLQRVGLAGEVHAADDGADRSADDDVGLDAVAGEGANEDRKSTRLNSSH